MNEKKPATSMNNEDEVFFENYLQGGSPLSEIYKKIDTASPSDELDQKILSAAQTSINKKITSKTQKWSQITSWAASIAVFSIVGLLVINTWQAEQNEIQKELLQSHSIKEEQSANSPLTPDTKDSESKVQRIKPQAQSKKTIPQEENNDSRKLLYKINPAPVMQTAPAYIGRSQLGSLPKKDNSLPEKSEDNSHNIYPITELSEETKEVALQKEITPLNEPEVQLEKIRLLIKNNKIDEAHELMLQFKIKYPDYTIDPVIIQHLPPYQE
ncbi:MAG: hypothetical protein OQL19_03610 [Gammaproteobacteria bacterium]|nr:hypothetical protein [Gammaproteobacteria bacterium]